MSNTLTNNLSRKKIQQLLAAVGSEPREDTSQIEAAEYDWHQPHCFNGDQLNKLSNFARKTATAMSEKFAALCHSDFNVTIAATTQHFAYKFIHQVSDSEQGSYYLAFSPDEEQGPHLCGFISIPLQTATVWATQLLGDSESEKDSGKNLSQLEESLLLDIAHSLVEAFSDSYDNCDFHPAGSLVKGQLPIELQGAEELCKITFSVQNADSKNSYEAHFVIICDKLEPVVGKTAQAADRFSYEQISKAILDHLKQLQVSVTAQLARTIFTFEEVMNLQTEDVLLLDKGTNELVQLIVEGRELFRGWPAKSAGRRAVVITEMARNTT